MRFGINLGFLERPLFAGFIWGLLSGDMMTAVFLGVFYELFWLDTFPVGTYIPPNGLFPMFCVATLAGATGDADITKLFLPIILTLPLAFFGAFLEKKHREWQVAGYERLIRRFRAAGSVENSARLSIGMALTQSFFLNFTAFFCVTAALFVALNSLYTIQEHPLIFRSASWPLLWAFGAVGGVLALRIRRSYAIFVIGAAALALMVLLGIRW